MAVHGPVMFPTIQVESVAKLHTPVQLVNPDPVLWMAVSVTRVACGYVPLHAPLVTPAVIVQFSAAWPPAAGAVTVPFPAPVPATVSV